MVAILGEVSVVRPGSDRSGCNHGLGYCKSIIDVLKQFDFTGNAIAFDLRAQAFFDPAGGRGDFGTARNARDAL